MFPKSPSSVAQGPQRAESTAVSNLHVQTWMYRPQPEKTPVLATVRQFMYCMPDWPGITTNCKYYVIPCSLALEHTHTHTRYSLALVALAHIGF